ncbi:MAG: ATP-binding cassette domain-containing protein [Pseudomonadota bacterium]
MLALEDASYGYGDTALLSEMSLNIAPGGFYFLTGPSGSGKTTFLKLCYLDLAPTSGDLRLFGLSRTQMHRDDVARSRRRIGIIHQDCRFVDHLSIRENIRLPVHLSASGQAARPDNLSELLRWVGLEDRQDAFPPELSGGERQRAALARAVIMSPDLILADEPTGNVDWEMSERLLSLLVALNKQGKTVVMATHDLPLIRSAKARVAVRVLRLRAGHLREAGAEL